jgi:hypothetical protein
MLILSMLYSKSPVERRGGSSPPTGTTYESPDSKESGLFLCQKGNIKIINS